MKKLIALSALLALFSCDSKNKFTLGYGNGRSSVYPIRVTIVCDSFQMISSRECVFWQDGVKGNIKAEEPIMVSN